MKLKDYRIKIREGSLADASNLAKVAATIFYDAYLGMMPTNDLEDYIRSSFNVAEISNELQDPKSKFLLVFFDDLLMGYAKLTTERRSYAKEHLIGIDRMYIQKEYQGKGIGFMLMDQCIQNARDMNFNSIWLAVWEKNEKAMAFYQRCGFEIFSDHIFMRGSDAQTGILMSKMIGE